MTESNGTTGQVPPPEGGQAPEVAPRRKRAFRPEIQGLRAFAVLLVAIYHIWFGRVSGGVDVFLMISAFLMTLSFTGKIERGVRIGWTELTKYWFHVFKRIMPLVAIIVAGSLVLTRLFVSPDRWLSIMHEAFSVTFYYENWFSIVNAVDYYASDSGAASPLRHFWSLSIQGQIFIMWPLLFALGSLLVRKMGTKVRPVLATIFAVVFVASFAFSVYYTYSNQTAAYFNTFARLWEFAMGSLAAIVLPWIRVRTGVAAILNWVGLLAILTCGALLDVEGQFPGFIALWPTLAASFIIICGQSTTKWGADRLLKWKPLVWLGSNSYGLYLVHWPLLVFYLTITGREKAGFFSGVVLLALSIGLAYVLTKLVDTPIRKWKWAETKRWRAGVVILGCIALGVGSVLAWQARIAYVTHKIEANADKNNPGAEILDPDYTYKGDDNPGLLPTALTRSNDFAEVNGLGQQCDKDKDFKKDMHGLSGGECYRVVKQDHPSKHVVAVGNSHTEQWMTALKQKAQDDNWDLTFVRHPGCFFTSTQDNWFSGACQEWLPQAEDAIQDWHPDNLVIQSTFSSYDGAAEGIREGTEDQVRKWTSEGVGVIGIRDNARFAQSHTECENKNSFEDCTFPHATAGTEDPTSAWRTEIPGYGSLDMDDLVCPDGACPPAVGNIYTYIDDNHLTATYVRSMQKFFDQRYDDAAQVSEDAMAQAGGQPS
ncbi:acyltransferase family protein [Kocuria koreensis]|jgi:peptidoglycan/LPS O-acetylase OafA/YrhL|uniref:Acyltransferase family protein n=1 Tax=Rothia koreensis TaxID=592378 RepID=A0A7K1LF79_9MICC|nr:acyltransferase family protein [Rothia koreensis]MUN53839.1 acyltransferase family protein [Rothia koreensis]